MKQGLCLPYCVSRTLLRMCFVFCWGSPPSPPLFFLFLFPLLFLRARWVCLFWFLWFIVMVMIIFNLIALFIVKVSLFFFYFFNPFMSFFWFLVIDLFFVILSSIWLTQYGKHKPCFNPDSLIICVQNSIPTILLENLILLYWFNNLINKDILYYRHAETAPS